MQRLMLQQRSREDFVAAAGLHAGGDDESRQPVSAIRAVVRRAE